MKIHITDEQFCHIHSQIDGEHVDHIDHVTRKDFTGMELKEYLEQFYNKFQHHSVIYVDIYNKPTTPKLLEKAENTLHILYFLFIALFTTSTLFFINNFYIEIFAIPSLLFGVVAFLVSIGISLLKILQNKKNKQR